MPCSKINLKDLIDARLIRAGKRVISLYYKKKRMSADLLEDGSISWDGHLFRTVSSFSRFVKSSTNQSIKTDNGWDCVLFREVPLSKFRDDFMNGHVDDEDPPTSSTDWTRVKADLSHVHDLVVKKLIDHEEAKILRAKITSNIVR
jgi:hypothetical protein